MSEMWCNISWPAKVEFIILSLNREIDVPLTVMRPLYTAIIDKLEASKSKIFGNIEFAKTASRVVIKPLNEIDTIHSIAEDLCRETNTNALFVVIIYPKENEHEAMNLARDLSKNFRFAVAVFNKTFADVLSDPKNPSKEIVLDEIGRVTDSLLRDVSKVIVRRRAIADVPLPAASQACDEAEQDTESPKSVHTIVGERKLNDVTRILANPTDDIPCYNERFSYQMNAYQDNLSARNRPSGASSSVAPLLSRSRSASLLSCPAYDTMQNLNQLRIGQSTACFKKTNKNYIPKQYIASSSISGSTNNSRIAHKVPMQREVTVVTASQNSSVNNSGQCFDLSKLKLTTLPAFKRITFQVGQYYDIVVTHITENGDFYFQLYQHRKYIDFLVFRMQLYYLSLNDYETCLPYDVIRSCEDLTEVWCAAPFSCDPSSPDAEHYYRAKIVARVTPTNYDVLFVDYGNRCIVPFSRLKFLPETFKRFDSFAYNCRLSDATFIDASVFKEKLASNPFALACLDNLDYEPWQARLFLTDGHTEEDVGAYLASIGAATFDMDNKI